MKKPQPTGMTRAGWLKHFWQEVREGKRVRPSRHPKCDPELLVGLSKEQRKKVLLREKRKRRRHKYAEKLRLYRQENAPRNRENNRRHYARHLASGLTSPARSRMLLQKRVIRDVKRNGRDFFRLTQAAAMIAKCG